MNYKESMYKRLDRRVEKLLKRVERLKRLIAKGKIGGESERLWLDEVTEGMYGVDVCCGDFTVDAAVGVDTDHLVLGADFQFTSGDELTIHRSQELDFVSCNYFEAFPNVLKVLNDWFRALKPKGFIAIIVRDASSHINPMGPLSNRNRQNVFTEHTIKQYLHRAGFENPTVEPGNNKSLRVRAWKPRS